MERVMLSYCYCTNDTWNLSLMVQYHILYLVYCYWQHRLEIRTKSSKKLSHANTLIAFPGFPSTTLIYKAIYKKEKSLISFVYFKCP